MDHGLLICLFHAVLRLGKSDPRPPLMRLLRIHVRERHFMIWMIRMQLEERKRQNVKPQVLFDDGAHKKRL